MDDVGSERRLAIGTARYNARVAHTILTSDSADLGSAVAHLERALVALREAQVLPAGSADTPKT